MRIAYLFLAVAGVLLFAAHAAAQMSDSLYRALPDSLRPAQKALLTQDEKIKIMYNADASFVFPCYKELYALAQSMDKDMMTTGNQHNQVWYAMSVAAFYIAANKYGQAIGYFKKTIAYAGNTPAYNRQSAIANIFIGSILASESMQDSAVVYLHQGLSMAGSKPDSEITRYAINAYQLIYKRLNLYNQTIFYARQYLTMLPANYKWGQEYTFTVIDIADCYALVYFDTKDTKYKDSANTLMRQIMRAKRSEASSWYATCYLILGRIQLWDGQYKAALSLFDSSLQPRYVSTDVYTPDLFEKAIFHRAIALVKLGNTAGLRVLDTIKLNNKDFSSLELKYYTLYQSDSTQGKWQQALLNHEKYTAYVDSQKIIAQRGKIFEAEQKYQVAQKEADVARLEKENVTKEKDKQHIINIAVITAMAFVIALVLLYAAYKKQQLQRLGERERLAGELNKMELQIQRQHKRDMEEKDKAVVEIRKNISRDMHDEVSASLAALTFFVGDMKQKAAGNDAKALLGEVENEARHVYQQARKFMHGVFNNVTITEHNVPEFLRNLSARFGADSGMQIITGFDEAGLNKCLTAEEHTEMYCIIREAVANSMKYSGATSMHINLELRDEYLYFEISDNGRGIKDPNKLTGIGLASIKERVSALKGMLQIDAAGQGTKLIGSFPV